MKLRCSLVVASLAFFSGGALADSNEDVVERVLERLSAAEDTNSPHGMAQFYTLCMQEIFGYWVFLSDENDDDADRVYKLVSWFAKKAGDIRRNGMITEKEQHLIALETGIFLSAMRPERRKEILESCAYYYIQNQ